MLRYLMMKRQSLRYHFATVLTLIGLSSPALATIFECHGDISKQTYTADEQKFFDALYNEVLTYIAGYAERVSHDKNACSTEKKAIINTFVPYQDTPEHQCLMQFGDVEASVRHVRAVLDNPESAKRCFDPQKNYAAFKLFTPDIKTKEFSDVANWLNRPLLTTYFERHQNKIIKKAGLELHQNFLDIISAVSIKGFSEDISVHGLPRLWSAVGWIPFYADRDSKGLNDRFKGGYTYAEVMGPWGLLRIKTIDKEPVGLELGMTVQLSDTFYTYHYHDSQEIYITLSEDPCGQQFDFAVLDNSQEPVAQDEKLGGPAIIDGKKGQYFLGHAANENPLTYFRSKALHSFNVGPGCTSSNSKVKPSGLVTMWARTASHEGDQKTYICDIAINRETEAADQTDAFLCRVSSS